MEASFFEYLAVTENNTSKYLLIFSLFLPIFLAILDPQDKEG